MNTAPHTYILTSLHFNIHNFQKQLHMKVNMLFTSHKFTTDASALWQVLITQEFDRVQFPSYENSNSSQLCSKQSTKHSLSQSLADFLTAGNHAGKMQQSGEILGGRTRKGIGPDVQQVNNQMWNDLAAKTYHAESDGRSITKTNNVGTNESLSM